MGTNNVTIHKFQSMGVLLIYAPNSKTKPPYDSAVIESGADLYKLCKGLYVEIVEGVDEAREYPKGLSRNQANYLFNKWRGKKYAPNPGGKRGPAKKPKVALSDHQISIISDLVGDGGFDSLQDAFDAVIASGVAHCGELG